MKKEFVKYLIAWLIPFISASAYAQDAQFTQFYATPLNSNPALAGTTPHYRFSTIYRNQWSAIPQNYETAAATFDYSFGKYGSGIGVQLLNDRVHSLGLQSNALTASYAYAVPIDNKWILRPAVQAGYVIKNFDFGKLLFGDQIDNLGATAERFNNVNTNYPTFGGGVLIYNSSFWFGLAGYHLNSPKQIIPNKNTRISPRYTAQMSYKVKLNKGKMETKSVSYMLLYQYQKPFQQLDFGLNYFTSPLVIGLWYRGLPLNSPVQNYINQDMIAVLIGIKHNSFRFCYSYDVTISRLSGSGGSHEIAIVYEPFADFRINKGSGSHKYIQCPAF
jgi:type IX secretion system PorP/SprF family membrane protein